MTQRTPVPIPDGVRVDRNDDDLVITFQDSLGARVFGAFWFFLHGGMATALCWIAGGEASSTLKWFGWCFTGLVGLALQTQLW